MYKCFFFLYMVPFHFVDLFFFFFFFLLCRCLLNEVPIIYFCICFWYHIQKNHFQDQYQGAFSLSFLLGFNGFKSYIKHLIQLRLVIVSGIRQRSIFILWQVYIQFSQHRLLKTLSFPHWFSLVPLSTWSLTDWIHGFILGSWFWSIGFCVCFVLIPCYIVTKAF